jgi:hypothetical protein
MLLMFADGDELGRQREWPVNRTMAPGDPFVNFL